MHSIVTAYQINQSTSQNASKSPLIRLFSLCLQEKVLLWLLQFMQEQAISLDEVDQNGNTAVHVAAQYGHLTYIQVCNACNVTIPLLPLSTID